MAQRLELEDVTLAYEERAGTERSSAAIVLVHGLGGSLHSWWAQLAASEEHGHRVIAYDQRGAGLIEAFQVDRPNLVGHSVGCMTCERASVALGDRAAGLVTIGGALQWREEAGPVFEEGGRRGPGGRLGQ